MNLIVLLHFLHALPLLVITMSLSYLFLCRFWFYEPNRNKLCLTADAERQLLRWAHIFLFYKLCMGKLVEELHLAVAACMCDLLCTLWSNIYTLLCLCSLPLAGHLGNYMQSFIAKFVVSATKYQLIFLVTFFNWLQRFGYVIAQGVPTTIRMYPPQSLTITWCCFVFERVNHLIEMSITS